jgi:hypothetical protein
MAFCGTFFTKSEFSQFQHHNGDENGDYTIAECFQPAFTHFCTSSFFAGAADRFSFQK